MRVITTKYSAATASRASRILVKSWKGDRFYPWDKTLDTNENHAIAAGHYLMNLNKERRAERGNDGLEWVIVAGGVMPDEKGFGFVIKLEKV